MLVKILPNKSKGRSAKGCMDYMLGKDQDRENARLLQGDPDLTVAISEGLDFTNKYTAGVLSFEEKNITESRKEEIMQDFERLIFTGLDKEQYNICWIEHTDKDRLELNFVIPNVELETGKRYQPYFDKIHRKGVNAFQDVTNQKYELSDPNQPSKKQAITLAKKDLPRDVKQIKAVIDEAVLEAVKAGTVKEQNDIVEMLKKSGLEVERQTKKGISIKNPNGERNIRLTGAIYETNGIERVIKSDYAQADREHADRSSQRNQQAQEELSRSIKIRREFNLKTYPKKPIFRDINRSHDIFNHGISNNELLAVQQARKDPSRTTTSTIDYGETEREAQIIKSRNVRGRQGRINVDFETEKGRCIHIRQRKSSFKNLLRKGAEYAEQIRATIERTYNNIRDSIRQGEQIQSEINRAEQQIIRNNREQRPEHQFISRTNEKIRENERQFDDSKQRIKRSERAFAWATATNKKLNREPEEITVGQFVKNLSKNVRKTDSLFTAEELKPIEKKQEEKSKLKSNNTPSRGMSR